MPYHVGDIVEVFGFEDEDAQSFFEATITDLSPKYLTIQHVHLLDLEDKPWTHVVPYKRVRPYPARIRARVNPGDDVDAWLNDGWVRGRYQRYEPAHNEGLVHHIHFPHMPEAKRFGSFKKQDVRLHQECEFEHNLQDFATWTYKRRMSMRYKPGDTVEIWADEQGVENYVYEATVDYVFRHQLSVSYKGLKDANNEPLEALVTMGNVRPYPAKIALNYLPGDQLDVLYNHGWRSATYDDYNPSHPDGLRHQVRFNHIVGRQRMSKYRKPDIRLQQQFKFEDNMDSVAVWTYRRRI